MTEATLTTARQIPAARPARGVRLGLEIVLVALAALVLFALVLGRLVPMTGRQTIIVGGGSMEPSIALGSVAITEPVPVDTVGGGDVISIRAGNGAVVTHRVVRVVDREGGTWFELKGDANAEPDPVLVDSATMLGEVTTVIPYAGHLLRFLSIPAAVVTVLGLGISLVIALYLLDDIAAPRRRPVPAKPSSSRPSSSRPSSSRPSSARLVLPDGTVLAPAVAYRKRRPRGAGGSGADESGDGLRPGRAPGGSSVGAPRGSSGGAPGGSSGGAPGHEQDRTKPRAAAPHRDLHRGHRRRRRGA